MRTVSIPGLLIGLAAFVTVIQAATPVNNAYDASSYLKRFNYMGRDDMENGVPTNEDDMVGALKMFQQMANITVTGEFDQKTKDMMNMPRCGMPDFMGYSNNAKRRRRYSALTRWQQSDLTWRINSVTNDLPRNDITRIMADSLKVWSDVSQLTFQQSTDANADFIIDFGEGEHGDGNPFDGPSGVLAHAYFPTSNPIGGDAHFDDAEQYTDQTFSGINLLQVAAHEFGHSLGLGHSEDQDALMAPFYRGYQPNFELHEDDIAGIQYLYGENSGRPDMTMRPFTNPPDSGEGDGDPVPSCPGNVDTIVRSGDGRTFAFQGNLVYQIETTGVAEGFPQQISQVFAGLPNDLDAGFFYAGNGKTYLFKGAQYWRFSSTTADAGYPRPISEWNGLPNDIDAAFVWSGNGRIYFTKGNQYYRFNTRYGRIDSGYPRPLSVWGLPSDSVDAAQQWDNGRTYFYVGDQYFRYNDAEFEPDESYPRPTAYWWFGCGASELQAVPTMDPNGALAGTVPSLLALVLSMMFAFLLNLQ